MIQENYAPPRIIYILIGLASFVIVIAGIRAAEDILVTFLLALFFTLIIFPVLHWSRKKNIPLWMAILFTNLVIIAGFGFILLILGTNIQALAESIPQYHDQLENRWQGVLEFWHERGIDIGVLQISELISSNVIKDVALESVTSITVLIEESLLIFILMIFMLLVLKGEVLMKDGLGLPVMRIVVLALKRMMV